MNPKDYDDVNNTIEDGLMLAAIGSLVGATAVFAGILGVIFYLVGLW